MTVEESVDLNVDRLLGSSFHPKHGIVVPSLLADVVEHQLRLAHFTESPDPQDPYVFHPVVHGRATALSSFGAIAVAGRSWDRSDRRVGTVTLIGAGWDLGSSCRI